MDGHSSGTPVAERLARPTRAATRKHRCRLPGVPPLFGLAPGGVCRAASVAGRAVGSYPTVSPLPSRRTGLAVCSLWHFPWGRPRRPLTGTVSPWSPDFPHPQPFGFAGAAARPAGKAYKGVHVAKRKRKARLCRGPKGSHLHLDLAAIGRRDRIHPRGAVAGIVFQDRAPGRAAAETLRHGEVLHAVFDVGVGIE